MQRAILRGVFSVLFVVLSAHPGMSQSTAAEWFAEATRLYQAGGFAATREALERTLEVAIQEHNRQVESDARYYLGVGFAADRNYPASNAQFEALLRLNPELPAARAAWVKSLLGINAGNVGNKDLAKQYYLEALATYESLSDLKGVAQLRLSLAFTDGTTDHIARGLEAARKIGDRETEARLLHAWADRNYYFDDLRSAFDRLDQARSILEDLGDRAYLAGVLTSLGRLYRFHGHSDQAIPYYQRALELQKQSGDKEGVVQTHNAMATALINIGRPRDALRQEQQALELARQTASSLLIKFALEGVANCYIFLNELDTAAKTLEEARLLSPPRANTLLLLAEARFRLGQYDAALKAAEESLQLERNRNSLTSRAQALWKLGRAADAMADIREALESLERARVTLVPTDFMKQGFADQYRDITNLAVHVFLDAGDSREAIATAEQSRGRAFLDLLATKNLAAKVESLDDRALSESRLSGTGGGPSSPLPPLLTRGASADQVTARRPQPGGLSSAGTTSGASVEDLLELSKRLKSTILSYWIDEDSTIIWTISPEGRLATARTKFGEKALSKWIDDALLPTREARSRGGQPIELASRAGDTVLTSRSTQSAWRRLYDVLIRPIRKNLPSKGLGRLTIIPSGPLFRLSFAALMAENGRYLIEDYSIHYAPAGAVFNYTSQTRKRTADLPQSYLLVANPSNMPATADGKVLPRLPGADQEVRKIAQLLPQNSVTILRGNTANEANVRAAVSSAKVIHLATHGIVSSDDPLGSFLALGRSDDSAAADGRLTAEEVYGLELHADLVVLSACRTGLGRISGDGVAGLARAFFYAGTASVVSTLWDVADEPASQLIAGFFQSLPKSTVDWNKADALRAAELNLLRALRNGEVRVDTPFGKLSLPEDPILWAGFVVVGEP